MNETDNGIKNKTIVFYPTLPSNENKTIEIRLTFSGSPFKHQLLIFKQANTKDFLYFYTNFLKQKQS